MTLDRWRLVCTMHMNDSIHQVSTSIEAHRTWSDQHNFVADMYVTSIPAHEDMTGFAAEVGFAPAEVQLLFQASSNFKTI